MTPQCSIDVPVTEGVPESLYLTLARPVPAGSYLRLRANGVRMLRGLRVEGVEVGDGVTLEIVHRYEHSEMQRNWNWHIVTKSLAMARVTEDLAAGTTICVYCAPGAGTKLSGLEWVLLCGVVDEPESESFEPVTEPLVLSFVAGPAEGLEAYLKQDGRVDITVYDALGNPTQSDGADLTIQAGEERMTFAPQTGQSMARVLPPKSYRSAERVQVRDAKDREAVTNARPRALDGTPVFFGEFHWHTEFSGDGQRSITDALTSARDELGLDFAGPADHMSHNGTYSGHTPREQCELCAPFDEPGRFCVIPGAELSGRYGHANLYTDSFTTFLEMTDRFPETLAPAWEMSADRYPLQTLADLSEEGRALIVPHHSNMDSWVKAGVVHPDGRPFWCAMHFPIPADRRAVRLFEMVQTRGSFETEEVDPRWKVEAGGYGGSARTALMRGYRMGFIAGTDNHTGWPTRGSAGEYSGVTGIIADKLDGVHLFQSLYRRRCYATSGARIVADATLNGHPIGSELLLEPGAERLFRIKIHATAPLDSVQVIHMGCVLADLPVPPDCLDFDTEWADERPGRALEDAYYYVRARQADGHCVWLSPFWVDLIGDAGW